LTSFQEAVLDWSDAGGGWRDLPWRRTRDPWAILVSEVMLQQTQAARVVPRWHAFLGRFPDPATCAQAPVAEVIGLWVGLGYNRRAVQLHRAAVAIAGAAVTGGVGGAVAADRAAGGPGEGRRSGWFPDTLSELLALPGVGRYTARAVLAFAFERPVAVVDTNVARVVARAVAGRRLAPAEAQAAADGLVPPARSWAWNQALLDLGAHHCSSRPSCAGCPLREGHCVWARAGFPAPDPASGSAGVSGRQSPFPGSDRQGRGRLVMALHSGPLRVDRWADAAGWPRDPARAARVAASLVTDGLAVRSGDQLRLP
jgi:A/G-specific adenine glycosylase